MYQSESGLMALKGLGWRPIPPAGISTLIVRDGSGNRAPAQQLAAKVPLETATAAHQWMAPWLMFDSLMTNLVAEDSHFLLPVAVKIQ